MLIIRHIGNPRVLILAEFVFVFYSVYCLQNDLLLPLSTGDGMKAQNLSYSLIPFGNVSEKLSSIFVLRF